MSHSVIEIFCCYAHEDDEYRQQLETHLSALKRQGLIAFWHDRLIVPGTNWAEVVDEHLNTASIILLLVSANFIASDYCYGIEMKRALERHETREARVIPIVVRPCDWQQLPFGKLQALPADTWPISTRKSIDDGWALVAVGLRHVIEDPSRLSINPLQPLTSPIKILNFAKLSPQSGEGLGYEILLKNESSEDAFVEAVEVSGVREVSCNAMGIFLNRAIFEVHLDAFKTDSTDTGSITILNTSVYDPTDQGWGINCQGSFEYEDASFHEQWRYSLAFPCTVRIPPKERVFLRILFRGGSKHVLKHKQSGSIKGRVSMGLKQDEHKLFVKLEGGEILTANIGNDFFLFLTNAVPNVFPVPLTWEDREATLNEIEGKPGTAKVKVTLTGRPGRIAVRENCILVLMQQAAKIPSLPKGLPVPPLEQVSRISYNVYIGIKQWGKVAEALRDPEDVLILEGWQILDQQSGAIAVYAMSATTRKLQREVIDIPKIVLEWSPWVDWQDIKVDKRLKENKDKVIPPESSGVYEVKYKNDDKRLYIGHSRGGLRQRVKEELVKGFQGSGKKPVHPAWQPITSSEDVSNIVVRWAITDRPAAVEEALHMNYRESFGELPRYVRRT